MLMDLAARVSILLPIKTTADCFRGSKSSVKKLTFSLPTLCSMAGAEAVAAGEGGSEGEEGEVDTVEEDMGEGEVARIEGNSTAVIGRDPTKGG